MSSAVAPQPAPAWSPGRGTPPQRILESAPDPLLVIDADGTVLWANPATERVSGRSLRSLIGTPGLDLVHPDDLEFALLSMTSVMDKEVGSPIEVRLRAHDGWRLVELVGAPIEGSARGQIIVSLRDLTDRRRFEVAADDDALFRSLVHNSTTLTMLVEADGRLMSASGALTRLLGHDPGVVAGHPLTALVEAADVPTVLRALGEATRAPSGTAGAVSVEARLVRTDGRAPLPFQLTIVNLVDDPTVGGLVVSGHDISDRKAAESETLKALSLLSATLDSTNDGILVVDRDGVIATVNARFAELWRLPADVLASRDDAKVMKLALRQLVDPGAFLAKLADLYAQPAAESHDIIHFLDGRVFERYSRPQWVDGEIVGRVWSFRDVTERKQLEDQLAHQALHDSLTGLANQSLFRDRVEHALARLERPGGRVAVLFLDLDNFKGVNDSLGHSAGDRLLVRVAKRIERTVRAADTAARLGGDEFAVLLENPGDDEDIDEVAERLLASVAQRAILDGTEVATTVSIGVALGDASMTCDQLLRDADLAMYTAKRRGRGRAETYRAEMHAAAVERLTLEAELRRALDGAELTVHYQPIVDVASGRPWGVEALARWQHPRRGLLAPDAFLPTAEEAGLVNRIDRQVLAIACAQAQEWRASSPELADLTVTVNVSAAQLVDDDLVDHVRSVLAAAGLAPSALVLEITEGAMMHDTDAVVANLNGLKGLGVRVALDDFGTGYSSLAYLRRFSIDILKVDKSFIESVDGDTDSSALAHAIIDLAQTLRLTPVAEGVERVAQRDRLGELGCPLAQGYLFAHPQDGPATGAFLRDHTRQ
jgi:diguanylate cyclase (GGDEF)-like protein/PAS domain S-box-containing protein